MTKKFELTSDTMVKYGRTFYRIRALVEIKFTWGIVKKGDLGGYIEKESCLSQEGNAWVFENGLATQDAVIWGGEIWGGVIWGGVIWGGEIWGGEIWGGEIWGGEIRGGVIWGGEIRGGEIWGGEIWGGEIRGGVIWGGEIRGGVIWGGEIWGGEIWGGVIWGGEIRGGEIWGGEIWGGEIRGGVIWGGEIRGGVIWGGVIKKTPLFIAGLKWLVTRTEEHLTIGCEFHTIADWKKFDNKRILQMSGKDALVFWKKHKKMILTLEVE